VEIDPAPRQLNLSGWLLGALGLVLAVATPVLSTLASGQFDAGNWWFWALVVAAGGTWVTGRLTTRQARLGQWAAEESERLARIETRIQIADVVRPLAETLAKMPSLSKAEKRQQCESMKRGVVDAVAELMGPERARAGWFEYRDDRPPRLVPVAELRRGRADPQRTQFVQGTPEGDAALDLLINDTTRFCPDVDLEPPPGWSSDRHSDYRTFISAGVVADGRKFGMLTLDALEPGDLTENDAYAISLLAKLLAAALAQV
jgi:transcriptional regulator with GAF, ATPase, and Fis domain